MRSSPNTPPCTLVWRLFSSHGEQGATPSPHGSQACSTANAQQVELYPLCLFQTPAIAGKCTSRYMSQIKSPVRARMTLPTPPNVTLPVKVCCTSSELKFVCLFVSHLKNVTVGSALRYTLQPPCAIKPKIQPPDVVPLMLDDDSCPKHAGIFWFFGKATFFCFLRLTKFFSLFSTSNPDRRSAQWLKKNCIPM